MGQASSQPTAQAASSPDPPQLNRRSTLWRRSNVSPVLVDTEMNNFWPPSTGAGRRQTLSSHRLSRLLSTSPDPSAADTSQPSRTTRLRRLYNTVGSSVSFGRQQRDASSSASDLPTDPASIDDSTLSADDADLRPLAQRSFEDDADNARARAPSSRRSSLRLPTSLSDRLMTRRNARPSTNSDNAMRRRRQSNRPLEDNTALLSRLLSVAAAATAATLLEGNERALTEARGQTLDGDDGSFGSFLQSLESGRLATALRQGTQPSSDGDSSHTPLNFFRMFRFATTTAATAPAQSPSESSEPLSSSPSSPPYSGGTVPSPPGRMVPIIIVGIRAVTPGASNSEDAEVPPFLDALSTLQTAPFGANTRTSDSVEPISRPSRTSDRLGSRRRASFSAPGHDPRPSLDSQRQQSRPTSVIDNESWAAERSPALATPSPRRAPTLIPRHAGSAHASSQGRQLSLASSGGSSGSSAQRGNIIRTTTTTTLETPAEDGQISPSPTARQRRVSDSDQPARPFASRRNGIVEPDIARPATDSARSWIIYVLGGSYPENHPILTTLSLFTDSPTYEDMMLLSALLGPAKAPVASEKDIEEAGGLYKIEINLGEDRSKAPLVAIATDGEDRVLIAAEQRCLVCLCDLEAEEEARKLGKCGHLFHRECIDEWLTKGRNSCPLCRAQGVNEEAKETSAPIATSEASDDSRSDTQAASLTAHDGPLPVATV